MIDDQTSAQGSATTVRASGPSGWRLAAIGGVAVLAVAIGAALGAYLLGGGRGGSLGPAAAYAPADSVMYFELRTEPSADQDEALREILQRFPAIPELDLNQPLAPQLGERIDEMLGMSGLEISWSEDVDPWFDGTVSFAVTEVPSTTDPMMMPGAPSGLVLFGVSDRAAAEAAVDRILSATGEHAELTLSTHQGATVVESEGSGAYAITDGQMIVAGSADEVRAAIDAEAAGSGLAQSQAFAELASELPSDALAVGVVDSSSSMDVQGAPPAMADAFEALMADLPTRMAFAVSAESDRLVVDSVSDAPTGAFAAENSERGLADEVPASVLFYSDTGNFGSAVSALVGAVKDSMAADPMFGDGVTTMESVLGAELEELVAWMDDVAFVAGVEDDQPYAGILAVPTDAAEARRRLDQLSTFAGLAATDPTSGITVEQGTVGGTEVTTIRWTGADPAAMPVPAVVVEYAVTDDRAIIGVGEGFVADVLELDAAQSLASNATFTEAITAAGGMSNAGATWLDVDGVREAVEDVALAASPEMAESYEAMVRGWLVPLDQVVQVARVDGDRLVQRAELRFD